MVLIEDDLGEVHTSS